MTRIDRTISFEIPDYWTPEQAYAVFELLQGLCECILSHYETQIIDEFREQHMPFDTDRSEPVSKDNPPYDPDDVPF